MAKYIAFDTETERGKAFLLATAQKVYEVRSLGQAFTVLFSLGERFTTFNLDYDALALLAYMPLKYLKQLYLEKEIEYNGYFIEYLPKKVLKVTNIVGKSFIVFDIYPFFQTSLKNAAKKYCPRGMRKIEMPASVKKHFSRKYYRANKQKLDKYVLRDSLITQWLTDKLVEAIEAIGVSSDMLYSPGYIAKRFFIKNNVSFGYLPYRFKQFVADGYFGAYIQCVKRGYFKKAYEADLKSAYPFAMANLPDFRNAEYELSKKITSKFFFVKAKVWFKKADNYLLPFRKKGAPIIFPRYEGQVATMTSLEYDYIVKHKLAEKIEIQSVLNIVCSAKKVYAKFIKSVFKKRSESPFLSLIYKLILNSAYGIAAEKVPKHHKLSIGESAKKMRRMIASDNYEAFLMQQIKRCANAWQYWAGVCKCKVCKDTKKIMAKKPKHVAAQIAEANGVFYEKVEHIGKMQNLTVAAFITATIRVKIFDIIRKNSASIIAVFTDGVFSLKPIKTAVKTAKLGQLEQKGADQLTMVGCGVYQFGKKVKMRGYDTDLQLKRLLAKTGTEYATVTQLDRVSLGRVKQGGIWQSYEVNELVEREKRLDLNFDQKRIWDFLYTNGRELLKRQCNSKPITLTLFLKGEV